MGSAGGAHINLAVFLTIFTANAWVAILVTSLLVAAASAFLTTFQADPRKEDVTGCNRMRIFIEGVHIFSLSLMQKNSDTGQVGMESE